MTFLRYSRLSSSSFFIGVGDVGPGEPARESEDNDDIEVRASDGVLSAREVQYPTPGFRCRSSKAADDCTFRNSSRNVWN
jgi:hypothetical protein